MKHTGGKGFTSGDIVTCKNIMCLTHLKKLRGKKSSNEKEGVFIVLSKNHNLYNIGTFVNYSKNVNKISTIMARNISMTKKRKLLRELSTPFYSVYSHELSPYVPILKTPLSKMNNKTLIQSNFFAMISHGSEFQKKPDIPLGPNQFVIINCVPGTGTCIPGFAEEFSNFFKSEKDILNYYKSHPHTDYCVYENNVPDIMLSPRQKTLRFGLYNIPITYELDSKKKYNFIKKHMPALHKKSKISEKVYMRDLLHKNPFIKITSENYYTNMKKGKINLKNVINKLQKKYDEFTLIIIACRIFTADKLTLDNKLKNFQKSKLIEPILMENKYF